MNERRCKECGERLPDGTDETFCGDDCEANYKTVNGETE